MKIDGNVIMAEGFGYFRLFPDMETCPVLYVPDLADCLISISQLAKSDVDILFSGDRYTLTHRRSGALMASFVSMDGLYVFDTDYLPQSEYLKNGRLFTEPPAPSSATTWTGRLKQAAKMEAASVDRIATIAYENKKASVRFMDNLKTYC